MDLDRLRLVGMQRAEFAKAARLQTRMLRLQMPIAILAAIAVLVTDPTWTYLAAGLALALAIFWAWVGWNYKGSRSQAERARRAIVLMDALGDGISVNELRDLQARFTVAPSDGAKMQDASYFAAQASHGPERLGKILEECAFWSSHLLRHSGNRAWLHFIGYFLAGLAMLFFAIPFVDNHQLQLGARIFSALLTLLLSAEVLGVALSYNDAARIVDNILPRLEAVAASGFPQADLLLIFSDYNSAVESAPMFAPGLYDKHRQRLNELWHLERRRPDLKEMR